MAEAVLGLVVDVFKESTEPLERLVRAALAEPQVLHRNYFSAARTPPAACLLSVVLKAITA